MLLDVKAAKVIAVVRTYYKKGLVKTGFNSKADTSW